MKKITCLVFLLIAVPLSLGCHDDNTQNNKMNQQYTAIRSMVSFLEFVVVVNRLATLNSILAGVDRQGDRLSERTANAVGAVIQTFPLSNKIDVLLERFGNQQVLNEVRSYEQASSFSHETKEHIRLVTQTSSIIVESLYRQNKITAEQKNLIQHIVDEILKSELIK